MAVWRRGKPDALMHHSDRGSEYVSEQFQRLMADSGILCSMSRSCNVWDNAAIESFFSSLKTERIERKTCRTRNEARADVLDYIGNAPQKAPFHLPAAVESTEWSGTYSGWLGAISPSPSAPARPAGGWPANGAADLLGTRPSASQRLSR
jgi:transposase InsO family protein